MIYFKEPSAHPRTVGRDQHLSKYILSLLLFGSNGIFASMIDLSSYEIVLFRTLLGSLLLVSLFLITGNKFSFLNKPKSLLMLVFSGMAMGASWLFLYEAYRQIGVSIATLCNYCGPVIVMVLAPILFKEKLTWIKTTGFITVLVGICLINSQALKEGVNYFGIICGLMSAVMYSLMIIFNKKCVEIKGLENSILQLSVSCLTVAVFVVFKHGLFIHVPTGSIFPIAILGLLNTGIGCYMYFSSIGSLPVQTVAICGYLEPLSAVFFSVLILKETMQPLQLIGAALIVGGAICSEGTLIKALSGRKLI